MNQYTSDALLFKALSDTKRLAILELLKQGEKCACVLIEELDIAQSALSYHMKILCESGIVSGRQDGKWIHYRISEAGSKHAVDRLAHFTTTNSKSSSSCCQ